MKRDDAYILCSLAADLHITQLVDGTKGVHAMIAKPFRAIGRANFRYYELSWLHMLCQNCGNHDYRRFRREACSEVGEYSDERWSGSSTGSSGAACDLRVRSGIDARERSEDQELSLFFIQWL